MSKPKQGLSWSESMRDKSTRGKVTRGERTLSLSTALASRLEAGHPWIYRNQIPGDFQAPSGTWVRIRAGSFSAYALWDASSQVALRVFSRKSEPNQAWVSERLRDAWELRIRLLRGGTTAFRLIFGEGDGLPGVVVDYYAGYCLLVTYSESLESIVGWVAHGLMELGPIRGVVRRSPDSKSGLELLMGQAPKADLVVDEGSLKLGVDLVHGQKTGLFLDHRDNRQFICRLAEQKAVLNLFCYTGAFSLAALAGGASHVTSVDMAAPSIRAACENFQLNSYDPEQFQFEVKDVFEYLEWARQKQKLFDLVISDPPSFAKRRDQLKLALKAYRKLAVLGLRVTRPGGYYAAASCTSQVSPEQFRQTLVEAGQRANRRVQLLHEASHAVDHPAFIGHAEGRYLKFVVVRVLEPC